MMNRNEILALAKALGADMSVWVMQNGDVHLTVCDFEGFSEDYEEIMRDYDEDAVDALFDLLERRCVSIERNLYTTFHMGGYDVIWGYESFDI